MKSIKKRRRSRRYEQSLFGEELDERPRIETNAIAELAGAMDEVARAEEKAKYATQEVKDDGRQ